MNESAQFRVQVAPTVRDRFKLACLAAGVTMSDQMSHLISDWLDPPEQTGDDQAPATDESEAESESDTTSGRDELADWLEQQAAQLLAVMHSMVTGEQLAAWEGRAADQSRQRNDIFLAAVKTIRDQIGKEVADGQARLCRAIETKRRDWRWLSGAALTGFAITVAMLWLVSGTGLGRSIAVGMTGTSNGWQAARLLAGNGTPLDGPLMSETSGLMGNAAFKEKYARCISRAKTVPRPFKCTLPFPLLKAR